MQSLAIQLFNVRQNISTDMLTEAATEGVL